MEAIPAPDAAAVPEVLDPDTADDREDPDLDKPEVSEVYCQSPVGVPEDPDPVAPEVFPEALDLASVRLFRRSGSDRQQ